MIVVDASAVAEVLLGQPRASAVEKRLAEEQGKLHAPQVLDIEVMHLLRKHWIGGRLTAAYGRGLLSLFNRLAIQRHEHQSLLARIWDLRDNFSAYDASYVALAEILKAPLVTCDARLARSSGHKARIELIS